MPTIFWKLGILNYRNINKDVFSYNSKMEKIEEKIILNFKNIKDDIYSKSKNWAVIFNENGKIMTSYKIEGDSKSFFQAQTTVKAKIQKGKTDEKFRKYFKTIRN